MRYYVFIHIEQMSNSGRKQNCKCLLNILTNISLALIQPFIWLSGYLSFQISFQRRKCTQYSTNNMKMLRAEKICFMTNKLDT